MPVKFRCPECHRLIAVPTRMVGKTINCPHNGCLVEVRADQVETAHAPVGNNPVSLMGVPVKMSDDGPTAEETRGDGMEMTYRPVGAEATAVQPAKNGQWLRKNVARFLPGNANGAATTLASDGRLPELKLQEGQARRATTENEGANPLVMVGVLCLSFVMSTALLLVDFSAPTGTNQQAAARKQLAEFYQQTKGPLAPYQQHLRDAQRAYSRGDEQTERQMYRKVLALLRAEGRSRYASLTRTPSEDRELEQLLATLMAD